MIRTSFPRWTSVRSTADRGATAVEYGLMTLLVAIAIVLAVAALGGELSDFFSSVEIPNS